MTEGQFVGATVAGKYRLRRLIGVGGMGSVYEGQHVDLAKLVAVKIIDSGGSTSAELATRFKREARAASAVESDNIVQVFDVGRDPDVGLYMVMELLHGEDLEMRLRKQPGRRLDAVSVAQIAHQVARALTKAHAARVVHRDLKPANIFLTEREDGALRVKILDFGISKLLASEASIAAGKDGLMALTAAGVALGTPQYMSPEQAQGLTTVDHRTDVWGLGVVMYEALAGVPAYAELRSYQETIIRILQERPKPLAQVAPWVPAALARVVHEAVEHDVTKRIADCATLARRIVEAVPEAGGGSSGPYEPARGMRASMSEISGVRQPPVPVALAGSPPTPPPVDSSVAPKTTRSDPPVRPITLGDDTQVVVRPSEAAYEEGDPSATMLADSARSTNRDPSPNVIVSPGGAVLQPPHEDAEPQSTGDPTMFQSPAWVGTPGDGPTTIKSVALGDGEPARPATKPMPRVMAASITALLVVGIGGGLLLARDGGTTSANGAPSPDPTEAPPPTAVAAPLPPEPELPAPAPPATGTAKAPAPPSTGAARAEEASDASPESRASAP